MVRAVKPKSRARRKAKAPRASKKPRWKLFFVTDAAEFEADFVIAATAPSARRVFKQTYGDPRMGRVELVTEIAKPPAWLTKAIWLGPDDDVLEELGGVRVPSVHFPRWQFGDRVWGYRKTINERYPIPHPNR